MSFAMPSASSGSSSQLVRGFSDQLIVRGPANILANALVLKVETDRAQEAHDLDVPLNFQELFPNIQKSEAHRKARRAQILEQETNKLLVAWNRFREAANLPTSPDTDPHAGLPDLDALCTTMAEQRNRIDQKAATKSGKAKKGLRVLCKRIQSHGGLFRALPKDDKYVCLIAGSLITMIEAAANHQVIAEAVDEILEGIEEDLIEQNEILEFGFNMKSCVYFIRLYVLWFDLLASIFKKWLRSGWARFTLAFDKDAVANLVTTKRVKIKELQDKLRYEESGLRQIEQLSAQERLMQIVSSFVQQHNANLAACRQTDEERSRKLDKRIEDLEGQLRLSYELGCRIEDMLQGLGATATLSPEKRIDQQQERPYNIRSAVAGDPPSTSEAASENGDSASSPQEDVLKTLASLQSAVIEHLIGLAELVGRMSSMEIDTRVQQDLISLLDSPNNERLWIEGPDDVEIPSQNTVTAAILTTIARQKSLPCVIYFNSVNTLANGDKYGSQGYHEAMLRDMILILVMQIIALIPEPRRSSIPLLRQHIEALRDATLPVVDALKILEALRLAGPPEMLFIIEYCQILEGNVDEEYSTLLLSTIGDLCRMADAPASAGPKTGSDDEHMVTKVCFTTDGKMSALGDASLHGLVEWVSYDCESDRLSCGETALWSGD